MLCRHLICRKTCDENFSRLGWPPKSTQFSSTLLIFDSSLYVMLSFCHKVFLGALLLLVLGDCFLRCLKLMTKSMEKILHIHRCQVYEVHPFA